MKALELRAYDGVSLVFVSNKPVPVPAQGEVLVKVHACGLNRADLGMTKGHVHGARGGVGTVLGMEWAGEVAELGPEAKGVKVGDRIMGSGAAAFAEYTLADHGRLFRAPSNMNFDEAATLPVALATMHNAVVTNGALQPGQSVDFPVVYFVDPAYADDPETRNARDITLSYTFYPSTDARASGQGAPATARPLGEARRPGL